MKNDDEGWDLVAVVAGVVFIGLLILAVDLFAGKNDNSNQRIKQELDSKGIVEFEK